MPEAIYCCTTLQNLTLLTKGLGQTFNVKDNSFCGVLLLNKMALVDVGLLVLVSYV